MLTIKVNLDDSTERFSPKLVYRGYAKKYGVNYYDTFSFDAKHFPVILFHSEVAIKNCPSYQLDITNPFLHGDLQEEVYMENLLGFLSQGGMRKLFIRRCLSMA